MTKPLLLGSRTVGPSFPTYIVAEISANHNHSIDQALSMIRSAKESGADAVKIQTYLPETMTIDCAEPWFRISGGTIWDGRTLYDLYREAHTPWSWTEKLFAEARSIGIDIFSTPFDTTSVDLLERFDPPAYKIASFEIVDLELIEYVAQKGRPIILSTGMSNRGEISEAVEVAYRAGAPAVALLKCTSAYPATPESMNILTISDMAKSFQCVI